MREGGEPVEHRLHARLEELERLVAEALDGAVDALLHDDHHRRADGAARLGHQPAQRVDHLEARARRGVDGPQDRAQDLLQLGHHHRQPLGVEQLLQHRHAHVEHLARLVELAGLHARLLDKPVNPRGGAVLAQLRSVHRHQRIRLGGVLLEVRGPPLAQRERRVDAVLQVELVPHEPRLLEHELDDLHHRRPHRLEDRLHDVVHEALDRPEHRHLRRHVDGLAQVGVRSGD